MTDKQPDALPSLYEITGNITDHNTVLVSLAELETLTLYKSLADEYGLSIFKDLKDLGDAGSDVQLLRMGYAAARLEIESLRGRGVEPAGEYPALPGRTIDELTESQRESAIAAYRAAHEQDPDFSFAPDRAWIEGAAYVDADRAMRAAAPAPQPSPAAQGDALDAARLDWLTFNLSGKALRDIGVVWSEHGDARRAIDAARAAQEDK